MDKSSPRAGYCVLVAVSALFLVACGSSTNKSAVAACKAEVLGKIEGKFGELDESDMLANARSLDDGNVQVDSSITYRRGTDQESSQTFNCTVAVDDNGEHKRVVRMQLNW